MGRIAQLVRRHSTLLIIAVGVIASLQFAALPQTTLAAPGGVATNGGDGTQTKPFLTLFDAYDKVRTAGTYFFRSKDRISLVM